jgi:hypothetical protein
VPESPIFLAKDVILSRATRILSLPRLQQSNRDSSLIIVRSPSRAAARIVSERTRGEFCDEAEEGR